MSDDFGIGEIAALISALAAAAGAATSIATATKGGPKVPGLPTPSKADLAASGAMRSELFGTDTPSFKANLIGAPVGPLPGAGSAIDKPIGTSADEFSKLLGFAGQGDKGNVGGGIGGGMGGFGVDSTGSMGGFA